MDKIEGILSKLFVGAAVLGGISCLARADYNLPLFIFVYFMWSHDPVSLREKNSQKEKLKIMGLILLTIIIDLVWVIYWQSFWSSAALTNWNSTLHSIVIFCSSINIILKVIHLLYWQIIIFVCMFLTEKNTIANDLPGIGKFLKFT